MRSRPSLALRSTPRRSRDPADTSKRPPVLTLVPDKAPAPVTSTDRNLNTSDANANWSFARNTPEVYVRHSGTPVALDVQSELPEDAEILIIAWSHTDKRLIPAAVHKLLEPPFRLEQAKLDALPSGRIELQALYRNGSSTVLKKHNLVVVGEGESPGDFTEDSDAKRRNLADHARPTSPPPGADPAPHHRRLHRLQPVQGHAGRLRFLVPPATTPTTGGTPASAVASVERGYDLLRDGKPDWLLFKSGDTWDTGFPGWKKSGRSASEKMLVGTYGTGDRPYFRVSDSHFIGSYGQVSHVAFVGLHAHAVVRDPADKDFQPNVHNRSKAANNMGGFVWLAEGGDILLEDCQRRLLPLQTLSSSETARRRCSTASPSAATSSPTPTATTTPSSAATSSGLFAKRVKNLYIEENLFDHNGWNPVVEGADRTKFNHNLYIQYDCSKVTAVGNIISRGSAHGGAVPPGRDRHQQPIRPQPVGVLRRPGGEPRHPQRRAHVRRHEHRARAVASASTCCPPASP